MKDIHRLLKQQLKRHLNKDFNNLEGPLLNFVKSINDTYINAEESRLTLETSLGLNSEESNKIKLNLTGLLGNLEKKVVERTAELEFSKEALKRSEQRLRLLYEAAPVGIFQSYPNGRYLYTNKRLAKMYGYESPADLIKNIKSIPHEIYTDPQEREWVHAQLREEGRLVGYETRRKRKDGSIFWASLSVQAQLSSSSNKITHYDGVVIDISTRKEAEKKLHLAKKAAEDANQAKSMFLANMSHEIRTPLNGIIGLAEIMLNTSLDDQQQKFMRQLKHSSYSLLSVLNDILDFSKIEAKKLAIDKAPVHIRELISECSRLANVQAQQKGLTLLFKINSSVPEIVEGDSDRLRQVILNLTSNAIKFTESGEILIEARFENNQNEFGTLKCSVKDTGPGIPEDKRESVFHAFEQLDGSLTRSRGGTGLGLSISYQLISLMGGNLECDSELGKGSTFYFSVPARIIKENYDLALAIESMNLSGMRMLVADSNNASRSIIHEILEGWGVKVSEAGNAQFAYARIELSKEIKKPYQVIICDIETLAMNDFNPEIVKDKLGDSALVLMVDEVNKQMVPSNKLAYVYKPVSPSDLYTAIMQALSDDSVIQERAENKKTIFKSLSPKRILLVEDTPLNQHVAKHMIETWGHQLVIAENGQEGFEAFISDNFDIVLMDIQMPVMDGLEATRHIRSYEEKQGLPHIPILAMTAHALKGDAENCLQAGMDDYISKPINWKFLFSRIEQYDSTLVSEKFCILKNKEHEPFSHMESFNQDQNKTNFVPTIDNLMPKFNDDINFLSDMIKLLIEEIPKRIDKIEKGIISKDKSKIEINTHSLKSMLGNFGKNEAYFTTIKIEKAAKKGDLETIKELHNLLKQNVSKLIDQLNNLTI
ncbi:response regulator [Maridesulfovibrio zosterae]|uniref:response regulator n=1 Tax=Maridesulfovibrio zosterae TaxID=82171 RepID=UPI000422EF90|nr:response regulator [Maridesulfovibrio zosterae]